MFSFLRLRSLRFLAKHHQDTPNIRCDRFKHIVNRTSHHIAPIKNPSLEHEHTERLFDANNSDAAALSSDRDIGTGDGD